MTTSWKKGGRSVATLAAVLLAVVLTGCGTGGQTAGSNASAKSGNAACSSTAAADTATPTTGGDVAARTAKLYEDAKKETGQLTVYSPHTDPLDQQLVKAFTATYPGVPKVEMIALFAGDIASRYAAERNAGSPSADIVLLDAQGLQTLFDKGWLSPADDQTVPELAAYSDDWRTKWGAYDFVSPHGLMYNTTVMGAPADVRVLLDPKLKGRIGLGDPRAQTQFLGAMYALDKKYGDDFMRSLAAQNPRWYPGSQAAAAAVAAGEVDVQYPESPLVLATYAGKNAPLAMTLPGLSGWPADGAVSTSTGCPATARLFQNFLLSQLGQQIITADGQGSSGRGMLPPYEGHGPAAQVHVDTTAFDVTAIVGSRNRILGLLGLQG